MKEFDAFLNARTRLVCLIVIFLIAVAVRGTGIVGIPPQGDEKWSVAIRVLNGQIIPDDHYYPPLLHYLNAGSFAAMYAIGRLLGIWYGTADFRAQYFRDPTPFIFAGRSVTVCLGALSAPLAALLAGRLSVTRKSTLLVAAMVALFPLDVLLSHIAKSDVGAGTTILLLAWLILRKLDDPEEKGIDAAIGATFAIGISFKQTALLPAAPAIAGMTVILAWQRGIPPGRIWRWLLVSGSVCILAWIPMNIGIILDLENYLGYQRVLAQMSVRGHSGSAVASRAIQMLASTTWGLTLPGLIAWLVAPVFRRESRFLCLWVPSVLAVIMQTALAGSRLVANHFLPYAVLGYTLGGIGAVSLCEREGMRRILSTALVGMILAWAGAGSADIVKQASAKPSSSRVARIIKAIARPGRDKILASSPGVLGVPISREARDEDHARHERLAKKYGVMLPARAPERTNRGGDDGQGYFVRGFTWVMGGLEEIPPEQVRVIKPFAWPIQYEEWDLDYWTSRGFTIFIVVDESKMLRHPVPSYRNFHRQIIERCDLIATIDTRSPLFYEGEVRVYRLRRGGRGKTDGGL
jgi:4-amino-4-deoxy-L-arabinose transferase-like glycosyltransferase